MLVNISQLNQVQLASFVQLASSGTAFSGNVIAYANGSGYFGGNVVYTSGGPQQISGIKTFTDSPRVPYSGNTGTVASAGWVNDQITSSSGGLNALITQTNVNLTTTGTTLYGLLTGSSGLFSAVTATGSATIPSVNLFGLGGTIILWSGNRLFISGAAGGGGGGSNISVTGSAAITAPNFTGVGLVTVTYDGTYVNISGAPTDTSVLSGYFESNFVHRGAVDEIISGIKTFTGNPRVPAPTVPSGAVNLLYLSGVSGVLIGTLGAITNNYYITGTGVVAAYSSGTVTNTFNVTSGSIYPSSSGTVTNTFNGTVNNVTNLSGITGNFVNMSFWLDQYNLVTGLNLVEAMVARSFTFTGYGIGAINTGTQGYLSGSFYQRTPTNAKTTFVNFSLFSGNFFYSSGGFAQTISGLNRVGLDLYLIGTGLTGVSIAAFGAGF